jgi:hypothetical protein
MDWTTLKRQIYFKDGALRDVYVLDATAGEWEKWVDLVNKNYSVEFWDAKTGLTTDKINFTAVKEYWDSNGHREVISATIKLASINVKCHFFDESEIENDIDPSEINSQEDHDKFIGYLRDISVSLDKDVIVTDENTKGSVLARVTGGKFILTPEARHATKASSQTVAGKFGWTYEGWMQDWPLEISDQVILKDCIREYEQLRDDDEKFVLMEAMLFALDREENDTEVELRWEQISKFLHEDFDIHKSTIYYWTLYGNSELEHEFRITPFLRKIWNDR